MSYQASDWAWSREGLSSTQRLVLLSLAHHVGHDKSRCWPSTQRLQGLTCLSPRALRNAIRELERHQLIRCWPGSGKRSSVYEICMDAAIPMDPPIEYPRPVPETPASHAAQGGITCRTPGHIKPHGAVRDAPQSGTSCRSGEHLMPPEPQYNLKQLEEKPKESHRLGDASHTKSDRSGLSDKQQVRFEEFWFVYPRKVGKGDARKAWRRIAPNAVLTEQICEAVMRATESSQWRKEHGKYVPHPATWLRREGWEDEHTVEILPVMPAGREGSRIESTIQNLTDLFGGQHGAADVSESDDVSRSRVFRRTEQGASSGLSRSAGHPSGRTFLVGCPNRRQ